MDIRWAAKKARERARLNSEYDETIRPNKEQLAAVNKRLGGTDTPLELHNWDDSSLVFKSNGINAQEIMFLGPFGNINYAQEIQIDYYSPPGRSPGTFETNIRKGDINYRERKSVILIVADPKNAFGTNNHFPNLDPSALLQPILDTQKNLLIGDGNNINEEPVPVDNYAPQLKSTQELIKSQQSLELGWKQESGMDYIDRTLVSEAMLKLLFTKSVDPRHVIMESVLDGTFEYCGFNVFNPKNVDTPEVNNMRITDFNLLKPSFIQKYEVLRNRLPEWRRCLNLFTQYLVDEKSNPFIDDMEPFLSEIEKNKVSAIDYKYRGFHGYKTTNELLWACHKEKIQIRANILRSVDAGLLKSYKVLPENIIKHLYLNDPTSRPEKDNLASILGPILDNYVSINNQFYPYMFDVSEEKIIRYLENKNNGDDVAANEFIDDLTKKVYESNQLEMYHALTSLIECKKLKPEIYLFDVQPHIPKDELNEKLNDPYAWSYDFEDLIKKYTPQEMRLDTEEYN